MMESIQKDANVFFAKEQVALSNLSNSSWILRLSNKSRLFLMELRIFVEETKLFDGSPVIAWHSWHMQLFILLKETL